MEGVVHVLTNNTFFTGETNGETFQAMVWHVVYATYPTGHSGVGPQTFMPHEFISELILELLSPLLKVVLQGWLVW